MKFCAFRCLRSRHLGLGRLCGQTIVLRIELRQQLARAHPLAQLSLALRNLARHAKAQAQLSARTHLASVFELRVQRRCTHGEQLDCTYRLGRWIGPRTARQPQGSSTDPKKPRTGLLQCVQSAHERSGKNY